MTDERQWSLKASMPYSMMLARPATGSWLSASISAGRPWQSQPKRRVTLWPRMVL